MSRSKTNLNLIESRKFRTRTSDYGIRFLEKSVSMLKKGEYSGYVGFFHKTDGTIDYVSSGDYNLFKQIGIMEDWKFEVLIDRHNKNNG